MIPQELIVIVDKLSRDMSRNPTVEELVKALNRAVASTPVVSTPATKSVASTSCPDCERRRKSKNQSMKKWRAKANA